MTDELPWQYRAAEQLSRIFANEPDAGAFILRGSLAGDTQVDDWSDVDAAILLADPALDRYTRSMHWLAPFGKLIGLERHGNRSRTVLRICMENFQRFDLLFIAESSLREGSFWESGAIQRPYSVVWSRLPAVEALPALPAPEYRELPGEELGRMVDGFWLKASQAIVKVARNDLLVGLHLALDLARDGLVLQMIRRDRALRTAIHRTGEWGNELVTRFRFDIENDSGEEILELIRSSCERFDELASLLLPDYAHRAPYLYPHMEAARQVCRARAGAG